MFRRHSSLFAVVPVGGGKRVSRLQTVTPVGKSSPLGSRPTSKTGTTNATMEQARAAAAGRKAMAAKRMEAASAARASGTSRFTATDSTAKKDDSDGSSSEAATDEKMKGLGLQPVSSSSSSPLSSTTTTGSGGRRESREAYESKPLGDPNRVRRKKEREERKKEREAKGIPTPAMRAAAAKREESKSFTVAKGVVPQFPPSLKEEFLSTARLGLLRRIADGQFPLKTSEFWSVVSTHYRLLDEFNLHTHAKRTSRTSAMMKFLADHNVLLHSLMRWSAPTSSWNVTSEFTRLAHVGEQLVRHEVTIRLLKAIPDASLSELSLMRDTIVSEENLAHLFDYFGLNRLLSREGRRQQPLASHRKAVFLFAMHAELHWFVVKTRATERTHNNALFPPSDALILHVLAAHTSESLPGELIVSAFDPIVKALHKEWRNFNMSLTDQLPQLGHKAKLSKFFALTHNSEPRKPDAEPADKANVEKREKMFRGEAFTPSVVEGAPRLLDNPLQLVVQPTVPDLSWDRSAKRGAMTASNSKAPPSVDLKKLDPYIVAAESSTATGTVKMPAETRRALFRLEKEAKKAEA